MTGGLESLYQELMLDHSKKPVGSRLVELGNGDGESHQLNPVCGDEITLRLHLENARGAAADQRVAVSWEGRGCVVSQASASMLTQLVGEGLSPAELTALVDRFREVLRSRGRESLDVEVFGDAAALSGVSKYSARVKCAMLAWVAAEDALRQARAAASA